MEKIALVSNALAEIGSVRYTKSQAPTPFKFSEIESFPHHDSWRLEINLLGKKIGLFLQISDWNFISTPNIFLKVPLDPVFTSLSSSAHFYSVPFFSKGSEYISVCYTLADSRELPRNSPDVVIRWVINQTITIIKNTVLSPTYRKSEILREIEPLWGTLAYVNRFYSSSNQRHFSSMDLFMDYVPAADSSVALRGWKFPNELGTRDVATLSLKTSSDKLSGVFLLHELFKFQRKIIDIYELVNFFRSLDKKLIEQLKKTLEIYWRVCPESSFVSFVLIVKDTFFLPFVIASDNKPFAKFNFNRMLSEIDGRLPPNLLRKLTVHPQHAYNLTADYIFKRNIEGYMSQNLAGRKIALIGCGAIGGHLALSVARLGGGSSGGELALIDFDDLGPQNLGRHALGKKYIGKKKSEALRDEIGEQFNGLNVTSFDKSAMSYDKEFYSRFDIVVDATGKVELSESLNQRYQVGEIPNATLLHVWIRGNGEAVQGILVNRKDEYACRTCLQETGSYFIDDFDALPGGQATTGINACQAFTPFSVGASMFAAALATDMLLEWANGTSSPRFRTRYTESWQGRKLLSCDAARRPDCSLCSPIYE